jgi:glutathionylspermidine synthase
MDEIIQIQNILRTIEIRYHNIEETQADINNIHNIQQIINKFQNLKDLNQNLQNIVSFISNNINDKDKIKALNDSLYVHFSKESFQILSTGGTQ